MNNLQKTLGTATGILLTQMAFGNYISIFDSLSNNLNGKKNQFNYIVNDSGIPVGSFYAHDYSVLDNPGMKKNSIKLIDTIYSSAKKDSIKMSEARNGGIVIEYFAPDQECARAVLDSAFGTIKINENEKKASIFDVWPSIGGKFFSNKEVKEIVDISGRKLGSNDYKMEKTSNGCSIKPEKNGVYFIIGNGRKDKVKKIIKI